MYSGVEYVVCCYSVVTLQIREMPIIADAMKQDQVWNEYIIQVIKYQSAVFK